jgi:hypothetical protein
MVGGISHGSHVGVVTLADASAVGAVASFGDAFIEKIAQHRHWERAHTQEVPA